MSIEEYPTVWAYEQACKALENKRVQVAALRAALVDVVETNAGEWEHSDDHCTPETECCAGHVARVLRETAS